MQIKRRYKQISKKEGKLLDAAQDLENLLGGRRVASKLLELFSEDFLDNKKESLVHQSVYLLPFLFKGPAITTNFDRVLENVYQDAGRRFDQVILPGRRELEKKIHGDIGREMIEYRSIIFTERQYQDNYEEGSELVNRLSKWFSSSPLLFLGCSLEEDEYLELLNEIIRLEPGLGHFAIIGCQKDMADERYTI